MQKEDGNFRNFLSFDRRYLDNDCSEDAFGRTIWSLGYLICHSPAGAYREFADALFRSAIINYKNMGTRGCANTLIGVAYYLKAHPSDETMFRILTDLAGSLMGAF